MHEYTKYSIEEDDRSSYAMKHPFKPIHCGMLPDNQKFRESKLNCEFFEPNDVYYHMLMLVPEEKKKRDAALVLWRNRSGTPFTAADCDLVGTLAPHLRRVVDLQHHFHAAQFKDNPALDVLETLPIGVSLCDAGARPYFMNSTAKTIMDQDGGLTVRHGELWCEELTVTRSLRASVREAVENFGADDAAPVATLSLDRTGDRSPLLVVVSAVGGSSPAVNSELFRHPVAVVYVSDPDMQQETSEELVQRLFGLTVAEARLLRLLVDGSTLKAAAEAAGITEGTARGYLKQIFAKTDTKGQADLIRHVSSSPAWLRHQTAEPPPARIENRDRASTHDHQPLGPDPVTAE